MQQDRHAAGGAAPAGSIAAVDSPVHVGVGFCTQFLACTVFDLSFFVKVFNFRVYVYFWVCCVFFCSYCCFCVLKVFRPLLNISIEFSAEEFETALITPNDTLSDIHIPLLKVCLKLIKMFTLCLCC